MACFLLMIWCYNWIFFVRMRIRSEGEVMERCSQCKKVLFKKKDGSLMCPNGCDEHQQRSAFNTMIDPMKERRGEKPFFDPWNHAR